MTYALQLLCQRYTVGLDTEICQALIQYKITYVVFGCTISTHLKKHDEWL
jgi:hypothetical protein